MSNIQFIKQKIQYLNEQLEEISKEELYDFIILLNNILKSQYEEDKELKIEILKTLDVLAKSLQNKKNYIKDLDNWNSQPKNVKLFISSQLFPSERIMIRDECEYCN